MKTIDRYLLFRMGSALLQAILALTLVYVFVDLFTHRQVDIRKFHVPSGVVVQYYVNLLPSVIQRIAPFSLLIAALLVLGDAAQNNEVTAVTASGISLRRFVRAPILLSLFFAVGLYVLDETAGPAASVKAEQIEQSYFSDKEADERAGVSWSNISGGWTCDFEKFNRVALTGEGVTMIRDTPDGFDLIEARRIFWDETQKAWILEDGASYSFGDGGGTIPRKNPIRQSVAPITETPETLFAPDKPADTKTSKELKQDLDVARQRKIPSAQLEVDYYAKFSQPMLSFVMIWLAIPFAMRLRRGGLAIGFGASVMIAIAYMLVFSIATSLGYAEWISPPVAAWFANGVFLAIGLVLYWRTPT